MDPQVITCDNTDLIMLYATISTLYHPANGNAVHFFHLGQIRREGAAASMAACCTHPLDVMRVRMQTSTTKTTFVNAVRTVLTQDGVRGLYTGLTASVFRQMTYSVTRLGVYDLMKNTMSNNGAKKLRTGDMVICASVAGALGGVAGNPADIILVRMVADPTKPVENQVHYRNAIHGVYKMVSNEGIASLARGLAPNTIRAILMNASQLVSYDSFKEHILAANLMENGMPLHFVSSALSGTVATTICAPADVVKSRIMNMKAGAGGHGPVGLLLESLKHEGPRFLFKGWLPAWIRLTPNTICMFVFLEQLRNAVDFFRNSTAKSQSAA
ncbi:solute carrier family 25 (mitochondrial dicarboxylate transporter), member 10 [Cryptococcus neoformans]|nr:solute carrier family 25 (mitochondrial dicarboxylate transporter), member 10 [Cryptococcus neoformans var. grubii Th84]OXH04063.1 solute carrier family 25 (mitochondrial dicarboxylate transporter), member 10 [Cryptococcus neoformans var. grubii]OXH25761.1 solute carrier family 25 (mitochondrial dicarboxylate transporter), member 10 [Cryptococcus neoformans var. grubii]OXH45556.1 solute carrier family 25 (mitochondrial dicarboxylate transporter), member 10 [Cryptococcus neoformans var. grubii